MLDAVAFRSKVLILTSGIFALDITDDEAAAIFASQVAHIITNHDEAVRSDKLLILFSIPSALPLILVAMHVRYLWVYALVIPPLAIEVLAALTWPRLGDLHSEEATKIGMLLMSEAGFNPAAAVSVEYKMGDRKKRLPKNGKIGPRTRGDPVSPPFFCCSSAILVFF